jgi:hypothetical protein
MKKTSFTRAFARAFSLIALCLAVSAFTAKVGLDSYEIYLNDRLLLKHYVNQPLNLRMLQLEKADPNDQLFIRYTHCNIKGAGTSRSIVIKDGNGHTLKQWEFADVAGPDIGMAIPVKELLLLEKNNADHELSIHYTARELPKGEMLASIRFVI